MKKIRVLTKSISAEDIKKAAKRAFKGHRKKPEVKRFAEDLDNNCVRLLHRLEDGTWKDILSYRPLYKTNKNGKRRSIQSPSLETRIYQHLMLNLLEPVYYSKDNLNGLNCKVGCGITAKVKRKSVVKRLKHVFYDRKDLNWYLVIDQRKCYEHITEKAFRRELKRMISDKWLIDFATGISFVNGKLPIGTPTSPFVHHVVMLGFDLWVKTLSPFTVRYADDNFLAFATKEEANSAKWRIRQFWWYHFGVRMKRHTAIIRPMDNPCDFCGYVFHQKSNGGHNKGYVSVRRSTVDRARKCRNDKSWASYFGTLKHADAFALMLDIEKKMKLKDLTTKIRIDRRMDARHIDIKDLIGLEFCIYDYEIRYNSQKEANWIKCLVGVDEMTPNGDKTGKTPAYEFHGNYQGIIQFILSCEKEYGKSVMLPLEEIEIENQCGYIFKGSTNQITYIEDYESSELRRSAPAGVGGHQLRKNNVA